MEVDDQVLVHVKKFRQHPVRELRREDLQVAGSPQCGSHLEGPACLERKAGRGDKILGGKPCFQELIVLEGEGRRLVRIECLIKDLEPLDSSEGVRLHAEDLEVVQDIRLDPLQFGPGLHNVVRLDGKSDIFRAEQAVIALGQLITEHLGVFHPDIIESIALRLDPDHVLKLHHA